MAVTPVGKQAEEFKFFCPLCMMFYRTMREMPCCQQYTQRVEGASLVVPPPLPPSTPGAGPPAYLRRAWLRPVPTWSGPDPDQVHLLLLPRRVPADEAIDLQPPDR